GASGRGGGPSAWGLRRPGVVGSLPLPRAGAARKRRVAGPTARSGCGREDRGRARGGAETVNAVHGEIAPVGEAALDRPVGREVEPGVLGVVAVPGPGDPADAALGGGGHEAGGVDAAEEVVQA